MNDEAGIIIIGDDINIKSPCSDLVVVTKSQIKSPCLLGVGKKCRDDFKKIKVKPEMIPNDCNGREWCKGKKDFKNGTGLMTNREIDKILTTWTMIDFNKSENDPNRINNNIKYLYTMPIQMIDFAGTSKFSPTQEIIIDYAIICLYGWV